MPSKILLDLTEPGIKEVVAGLAAGQKITLDEVEVTVDRNDANLFEATVDSISVSSEMKHETEAELNEDVPPASNYTNEGKFDMGKGA